MHFTTKQTVSLDKEGGAVLPEHIFNEVQLISHLVYRLWIIKTQSVFLYVYIVSILPHFPLIYLFIKTYLFQKSFVQ